MLHLKIMLWLILSGLVNALGEYLSKIWANQPHWLLAVLVALVYALSSVLWLPALHKTNQLSTMGTAWIVIAMISTLFLGIVVFHEQLSFQQLVGVILAIVAVIFLTA